MALREFERDLYASRPHFVDVLILNNDLVSVLSLVRSHQVLELVCLGEMERLQKFWMAGACKKNAKGEASKSLEVLNFTSAFILLACGMLLASFLLMLEHTYFAFFRVRLRKCDTVGCCSLVSLVSESVDQLKNVLVMSYRDN